MKNKHIQLPQKNGAIDFAFMGSFMAELEMERIAELELTFRTLYGKTEKTIKKRTYIQKGVSR